MEHEGTGKTARRVGGREEQAWKEAWKERREREGMEHE